MPQPVDLSFAFGLEPRAAVEYFRAKGYALTFNWDAMAAEAHARAFTVAKVMRMDVLTSIREELDRALAEGTTLEQFRTNLEPRLRTLGWWGRQVVERPDGTAQMIDASSPHRLETIYRTNLQSSYMAGRFRDLSENTNERPYWQYVAVMDERTRPAHAALNGKIFRFDDPIWQTCWPPNGYNCRCRVRALSEDDIKAKDLAPSSSGDHLSKFTDTDPHTGEVFERVTYKAPGMSTPFSPDRGFAGNQGLSASVPEIDAAAKAQILGPEADAALQELTVKSWSAWTSWVDDVFRAGRATGESRVLGYAQSIERSFVESEGLKFATGALEIEDRLMVGRKAARYAEQGTALSPTEWKVLPLALADREAVLFDIENKTLLYVAKVNAGDTEARVVVRPDLVGRAKRAHDSVRSVQHIALKALQAGLRGGLYRLVSGKL
jgi:SPP1 gp7 family putative phage head morphogenesis protein